MSKYINKKYENLMEVANQYQGAYLNADPFPSIYFKDFFNPAILDQLLDNFPDMSKENSLRFDDSWQKKLAGRGEKSFGEETKKFMHYLNSEPFLKFLQILTGIKEPLMGDPYFIGGGFHEIKRAGLLKIHADFNKHPKTNLDRRLNVLIYLNKDWKEEYGGHFELWDKEMKNCRKRILPEFNTLALFSTTDTSYHGHPDPLNCPENRSRKSVAAYYYSNGRPASEINPELTIHSTLFQARTGNETDKRPPSYRQKKDFNMMQVVGEFTPPILVKGLRRLLTKKAEH